MAVIRLKLSVEVLFAIDLISEGVNTVTIIPVVVNELKSDFIGAHLKKVVVQDDFAFTEKGTHFQ